ncbi:glycosyltransferase [Rhodovulum sp. YEN HP10]|uniref:glycosyltransferase n=1 Tax=Rhodovulum sp. HP10 TaxID=3387397 RepID=UPI0039DF5141
MVSPIGRVGAALRNSKVIRAIARDFDARWYLTQYPDVAETGMKPLVHYVRYGAREGRNPRPDFDGMSYLEINPDVRDAGLNPFYHWVRFGRAEGRVISHDPGNEGSSSGEMPVLKFSGLFTPLDCIAASQLRRLDLTRLPDTLMGRGFPYGIAPGPVSYPLVLFCDGTGDVPADRIQQALALTTGTVHVLSPSAGRRRGKGRDRLRYWNRTADAALADLKAVLKGLDGEFVGLWEVAFSPAISAWHFLGAALRHDPVLAHAGASLVRGDGRLWRSGFRVRAGQEGLVALGRDAHFLDPFQFRLKPSAMLDPGFGLARVEALRDAAARVRGKDGPRMTEAIARLAAPLAGSGRPVFAVQGCALVLSDDEPSEPPEPAKADDGRLPNNPGPADAVIFVDSVPPMPDQDAGSVTASNFIDIFLERGAEVVFYSTARRMWDNPYALALAARGVVCLTDPVVRNYAQACEHIAAAGYDRLSFLLTRIYAGGEFVERTRARFPQARLVFNTVDLHGLRELREARIAGSTARAFAAQTTFARERDIIQRCDATILLSEAEMNELSPTLGHANLHLIPMVNEFSPPRAGYSQRRGLMFIGGFAHHPNIDAVEYILDELWTPIRARDPEMVLKIVGPHFPARLRDRLPEGVEALGFVPDLGAALEQVRLSLAPLRYGAGIKGKIGTSLSHGVPCVATSLAAEGMGLQSGRDILVADTPEAFAEAVLSLHGDEMLWTRMSRAGYDFCEARYSRRAVAAKLNALLDEVSA